MKNIGVKMEYIVELKSKDLPISIKRYSTSFQKSVPGYIKKLIKLWMEIDSPEEWKIEITYKPEIQHNNIKIK